MYRKILLIVMIIVCFGFLSGCKDKKPRIFLSTQPIAPETFKPMNMFSPNDTINFVLLVPKGMKHETVRLQLLKKSKFSPIYGMTLELGKTYNVINQNYLTGAFTVYSGGRYELSFYNADRIVKKGHFPTKTYTPRPSPIAVVEFGVE